MNYSKQYIDKAAVVAEIEARYNECLKRAKIIDAEYWNGKADAYRDVLGVLDTLEVKEVVAEKEGVCNDIFNRIIGDNWNLLIPLDKVGLKHGDKVKILVTKENKL